MLSTRKFIADTKKEFRQTLLKKRVKDKEFYIISNNCWGAEVYKDLELQYSTPFIGLSIFPPCYLQLLKNLKGYLNSSLVFTNISRYEFVNKRRKQGEELYPLACLGGDIEIHFMHYGSEAEARDKWERRASRINWHSENIFVKLCDNGPFGISDLCSEELIREFDKLDFIHKVCFTAKKYSNIKSAVWIKEYKDAPYVVNGVELYKVCAKYFDVADWLNGGDGNIGMTQSLVNALLYEDSARLGKALRYLQLSPAKRYPNQH